jgi:hypothetical protein
MKHGTARHDSASLCCGLRLLVGSVVPKGWAFWLRNNVGRKLGFCIEVKNTTVAIGFFYLDAAVMSGGP